MEWDKAGAELWNLIQSQGVARGNDGDGEADWMDFDDEEKQRMQPTINIMEWSPNLSAAKQRILEMAGISRNFISVKKSSEDVSIFITEVKFRNK